MKYHEPKVEVPYEIGTIVQINDSGLIGEVLGHIHRYDIEQRGMKNFYSVRILNSEAYQGFLQAQIEMYTPERLSRYEAIKGSKCINGS